ncbi:BspA family leucine-rich repeat surface protein [Aliivibrio fischeri]|uniref:BspA family leucine-rich repeat surface protein n=1 Tax=Aliivibrio fischeri TaxID=668 RepID=UPI001B30C5DD|nr:BspA family leucine-rich repeat surface protein [Aliivibrio fischeri]MBP3155247.1 DUF285 domain-containing protein [Aliivibrio fischeri]
MKKIIIAVLCSFIFYMVAVVQMVAAADISKPAPGPVVSHEIARKQLDSLIAAADISKPETLRAIEQFDTSIITDMSHLFSSSSSSVLNALDLSRWDTSNVTDMSNMFYGAAAFNQDISGWNTANVTNMSNMFYRVAAFNQDISGWNTANVTDMSICSTVRLHSTKTFKIGIQLT